MKIIQVVSAKGGVGTTVTACAIALSHAEQGKKVLIVGADDVCAVLNIPSPTSGLAPTQVLYNLHYVQFDDFLTSYGEFGYEVVIVDRETDKYISFYDEIETETVLVVTNEYISLRNTVQWKSTFKNLTIVGRYIDDRPLTKSDAESVLFSAYPHAKVLWVGTHDSVARAVDAGLFVTRYNRSHTKNTFSELHQHVVDSIPVEVTQ